MLITAHTVAYFILSLISLFIGFVALWMGTIILAKWKPDVSTEEQYLLEKKGYLVITAMVLGLGMRIVMIPLWFTTLHSYIPSVPGAMCLAGIHQLRPSHSYIATGLKFLLPMLYLFWLEINHLDRQIEDQPLTTFKLRCLVPVGIVMCVETYFDWIFLHSVEPRQVTCCTSLFDVPRENVPELVSSNIWFWYALFIILTIVLILISLYTALGTKSLFKALFKRPIKKALISLSIVAGIANLFVFNLALHTKISPLFLHAPFHHCIFCVYYNLWDGFLFNALIIVGIWIFLIENWIILLSRRKALPIDVAARFVGKLSWISAGLLLAGLLFVVIHTALLL
jgi:hypothetical protein